MGTCRGCGKRFAAERLEESDVPQEQPARAPRGKRKVTGKKRKSKRGTAPSSLAASHIIKIGLSVLFAVGMLVAVGWGAKQALQQLKRDDPDRLMVETIQYMKDTLEFARSISTHNAREKADEAKRRTAEAKDLVERIQTIRIDPESGSAWNEAVEKNRQELERLHAELGLVTSAISMNDSSAFLITGISHVASDWTAPGRAILGPAQPVTP